jgi:hypothetical protein
VSTSGSITQIAAPTGTLNGNTLESDTTMYLWFETTVTSPGSLNVDHVGTGTVNSSGSANPQTIAPAFVESYVVHFDQAGGGNATLTATITFDHAITGIWHSTGGLGASDGTFAPSGLTYGSLGARGLELGTNSSQDRYSISSDGLTLTIIQVRGAGNDVDQLRILVSPEPGTGALLGMGVLALIGVVVRRRSARR